MRGCVSDRKDFYHQCAATRSRAFTNCLPFCFDKGELGNTLAFKDLVHEVSQPTSRTQHGDRLGMARRSILLEKDIKGVYAGFKSLFQGDHLGVEYALSAHQAMLRDGEVLHGHTQILRNAPFPSGPLWTGLVIDDLFIISEEKAETEPRPRMSMRRRVFWGLMRRRFEVQTGSV